jgi:hypothetical protein
MTGAGPPILRGAVPKTACMEVLQVGYLHAVVAAAGCTLAEPRPDRGIDWTVTHESSSHNSDPEVDLKIQLKCTHQVPVPLSAPTFPFTLENAHLSRLNIAAPTITRLLVVMLIPQEIEHWLEASGDYLALRHCSYWVNLAGVPLSGQDRTTVRLAADHVFDDVALCEIMRVIGQGGTPV